MPWEDEYRILTPVYNRLLDEVLFSLNNELARAEIKAHSVTGRIKTVDSLADKIQRKGYDAPLKQAPDVVGVRVVVLFLTDLPRVAELVERLFDITAAEDKIGGKEDPSTFGYMAQHYEGLIRTEHAGPRYDDLRGITFEIQLRTLLICSWMHGQMSRTISPTRANPVSRRN